MFPTELATVVLIIGLLFAAFVFNKGILMTLTGFVILLTDLQDTTDSLQTITMALIAISIMYHGVTMKERV